MPEQNQVLVQAAADSLLAALQGAGAEQHAEPRVATSAGPLLGVLVIVYPRVPGLAEPRLRDVDRDCLAVLAERRGNPISIAGLTRELERTRRGPYSQKSVERSLDRLKMLGWVVASSRKPRGHYLVSDTMFTPAVGPGDSGGGIKFDGEQAFL